MLSVDYYPSHFLRQQRPSFHDACSFNDPFFRGSRRQMSMRRPQRVNHHHHHHLQLPRSHCYSNFLDTLDVAPPRSKPQVFAKVTEDRLSFHIHIKKENEANNYRSYLISYNIDDSNVDITVESKEDEFLKVYRFSKSEINISAVKWKIIRNVLILDIPKSKTDFVLTPAVRHTNEESVAKPKRAKRNESQQVTPKPSTPKKVEETAAPKQKVISIPIDFLDTHEDVFFRRAAPSKKEEYSDSNLSDTDSEVSTASSDNDEKQKLPQIARKVTIEDVEDEAFMDLD